MAPSDSTNTPATVTRELAESISDLLEYDLEVVEVDAEDGDLEQGCLSCS